MSSIDARLRRLEQRLPPDPGDWCPECGYGQQLVIVTGAEPEPICGTCGRPKARGDGIRIIHIGESKDGPQ